jgi:glycosyltransferase involved in cell wall biosynthesis
MNQKIRILHLNTEKTFRGGELQTLYLIQGLLERGHQNLLIAQKNSPLAERAIAVNAGVHEIQMSGEWDLGAILKLRKIIQEYRPDILHAHTGHALTLAILARIGIENLKIVFSKRLSFALKGLSRYKYRSADAILAVSKPVRDQLIRDGIAPEKIYIAESGTDLSRFDQALPKNEIRKSLGLPAEAFVIGNISYFDANKGQETLIRSFIDFATQHPDEPCYLLLAGDGPRLEACRSIASSFSIQGRILFVGERRDVQNMYAVMDLFFLSSLRGEGWSGVLREAMASGLPSIAVEQMATKEQIRSGETGFLVSNVQSEWTEAMETLYRQPELREKLGKQAKTEARRFTIIAMVEKSESCYLSLLKRTNPHNFPSV